MRVVKSSRLRCMSEPCTQPLPLKKEREKKKTTQQIVKKDGNINDQKCLSFAYCENNINRLLTCNSLLIYLYFQCMVFYNRSFWIIWKTKNLCWLTWISWQTFKQWRCLVDCTMNNPVMNQTPKHCSGKMQKRILTPNWKKKRKENIVIIYPPFNLFCF